MLALGRRLVRRVTPGTFSGRDLDKPAFQRKAGLDFLIQEPIFRV